MTQSAERRVASRPGKGDRRRGERRQALELVAVDRRSGVDRRHGGDRRREARVGDQIRSALELLASLAQTGVLDDEHRRDLDAAIFRLRFALERLEQAGSGSSRGGGDGAV